MLRKDDYSQLELFSQTSDAPKKRREGRPLLSRLRGYEKIILGIIVLLVTAIASFSLGVEKGRSLALRKTNLRIDVASSKNTGTAEATQGPAVISPAAKEPALTEADSKTKEGTSEHTYTIQLASFSNKTSIEKEAALLRKKGYNPLVIPKGKYTIICVGSFSDRETANKVLAEFKKRYKDSLIRRL
ncbi:MAG: SPOR domain-containing protein [Candidatus Omnitrophota bacterium]